MDYLKFSLYVPFPFYPVSLPGMKGWGQSRGAGQSWLAGVRWWRKERRRGGGGPGGAARGAPGRAGAAAGY